MEYKRETTERSTDNTVDKAEDSTNPRQATARSAINSKGTLNEEPMHGQSTGER